MWSKSAGVKVCESVSRIAASASAEPVSVLRDEYREAARPSPHPAHRYAADERGLRLREQLGRARVLGTEAIELLGVRGGEAVAVDGAAGSHAATLPT
jgi:hypothetical protein